MDIHLDIHALTCYGFSIQGHHIALLKIRVQHGGSAATTLPPGFSLILAAPSGGERPN